GWSRLDAVARPREVLDIRAGKRGVVRLRQGRRDAGEEGQDGRHRGQRALHGACILSIRVDGPGGLTAAVVESASAPGHTRPGDRARDGDDGPVQIYLKNTLPSRPLTPISCLVKDRNVCALAGQLDSRWDGPCPSPQTGEWGPLVAPVRGVEVQPTPRWRGQATLDAGRWLLPHSALFSDCREAVLTFPSAGRARFARGRTDRRATSWAARRSRRSRIRAGPAQASHSSASRRPAAGEEEVAGDSGHTDVSERIGTIKATSAGAAGVEAVRPPPLSPPVGPERGGDQ